MDNDKNCALYIRCRYDNFDMMNLVDSQWQAVGRADIYTLNTHMRKTQRGLHTAPVRGQLEFSGLVLKCISNVGRCG
jgi:hypothetical protein